MKVWMWSLTSKMISLGTSNKWHRSTRTSSMMCKLHREMRYLREKTNMQVIKVAMRYLVEARTWDKKSPISHIDTLTILLQRIAHRSKVMFRISRFLGSMSKLCSKETSAKSRGQANDRCTHHISKWKMNHASPRQQLNSSSRWCFKGKEWWLVLVVELT